MKLDEMRCPRCNALLFKFDGDKRLELKDRKFFIGLEVEGEGVLNIYDLRCKKCEQVIVV